MTPNAKKTIRKIVALQNSCKFDHLAERADAKRVLDTCVEDGKIGVHRQGMDCDGSAYNRASVVKAPSGVFAFIREEIEHAEWLDGPETTRYCKPSELEPVNESRDMAAEAFEDGHPWRISYPSW